MRHGYHVAALRKIAKKWENKKFSFRKLLMVPNIAYTKINVSLTSEQNQLVSLKLQR